MCKICRAELPTMPSNHALEKTSLTIHPVHGTQLEALEPREIARLDIMAYLDPASDPGSKPQRLGATNC